MKNLVFIQNNKPVTSSRLVAQKFEKRHANILRDIENLECSQEFKGLNFEFSLKTRELHNGGHKKEGEYIITRDGFTFLVMGFTGKRAAQFKEEFIEQYNKMEERLQRQSKEVDLPDFTNPAEAARSWAEQYELATKKQKIIEKQAPKVQYTDNVLRSETCYTTTTIAKELGMSGKALNRKLWLLGVQYFHDGHWVLYAQYQNKGYTKTRTHAYRNNDGEVQTSVNTVWTDKGRAFIHIMLNDNMILPESWKNQSETKNTKENGQRSN